MFLFCKSCGKKETNKRPLNDNVCNECRVKTPTAVVENINIDDDAKLSDVSFGDFKTWISGTIRSNIQFEMKTFSDKFNEDLGKVKTELGTVKNELKDAKNDIHNLKLENAELSKTINDLKDTTENSVKYLINSDRNDRRYNAIFFGVPENNNIQVETNGIKTDLCNDMDKISGLIDLMGGEKQLISNIYRLGKKGDKNRPIKTTFQSVSAAKHTLTNSKKLANLNLNLNIYVKPDRTKGEMEEFKRLGKRKEQLSIEYPSIDERNPRVLLKNGVLSLDGNQIDKYNPVQSIF